MKEGLLVRLSNADAAVFKEREVHIILKEKLSAYSGEITYDALGSISFHKKGVTEKSLKIMFCAHMDEVGFLVRHISDIDFAYLIALDGVQQKSTEMQKVRIATASGSKVSGIPNITADGSHHVRELYVGLGCDAREEVAVLGVEVGNMVCFGSDTHPFNQNHVYAGKAMDDRSGCYVLTQAMKRLHELSLENEITLCATNSEEVGMRGGKTAVYKEDPDPVFAPDVANRPELSRSYTNHRGLGKGCMLMYYDKALAPNEELLALVKETAQTHDIPYQCNMFDGGDTNAGNVGISRSGTLAMVIGTPLRYCHGSQSPMDTWDLEHMMKLAVQLARALTKERAETFTVYQRGGDKVSQLEQEIVDMISAAGGSKAKTLKVLKMIKESRYDETRELLIQVRKIDLEAHKIQTKLITAEMSDNDEKPEVGLLMVYVQGHYVTSQLTRDLIKEMMGVLEAKEDK